MFPDDPRIIRSIGDLQEVANQMKIAAESDDPPEGYSKTEEEARRKKRLEGFTEAEIQRLRNYHGSRAIVLNQQFLSLVLTTDDHHGHQWHLSLVQITGPSQFGVTNEETNQIVLGTFFSAWKSVPNPGKMAEVTHFVGND